MDDRSLKPAPGFMLEVLFDEELDRADAQRLSTIVWSEPWLDGPYRHPDDAESPDIEPGDPGERELEFGRATLAAKTVGAAFHVFPHERFCSLAVHAYAVLPGLQGSRRLVNEVVAGFRGIGTEMLRLRHAHAAIIGEEGSIAGSLSPFPGNPLFAKRGDWGTGWPDAGGAGVVWHLDGFETKRWL
jgi:hypothetical protein